MSSRPHFLWVTEFPLFTRADDDKDLLARGRWSSSHHPFTAPMAEDLHLLSSDKEEMVRKIRGQHYDLVLDGQEIGGGSVRIHDAALQEHVFRKVLKVSLHAHVHAHGPSGGTLRARATLVSRYLTHGPFFDGRVFIPFPFLCCSSPTKKSVASRISCTLCAAGHRPMAGSLSVSVFRSPLTSFLPSLRRTLAGHAIHSLNTNSNADRLASRPIPSSLLSAHGRFRPSNGDPLPRPFDPRSDRLPKDDLRIRPALW